MVDIFKEKILGRLRLTRAAVSISRLGALNASCHTDKTGGLL